MTDPRHHVCLLTIANVSRRQALLGPLADARGWDSVVLRIRRSHGLVTAPPQPCVTFGGGIRLETLTLFIPELEAL